jgi:hypothetical protein
LALDRWRVAGGHPRLSLGFAAPMRTRLLAKLVPLALLVSLVLAPAASAYNNGRGFYGSLDDKVTTEVGFCLVAFFALFVFLMSMLQGHLEKRKDARKAAQKALASNGHLRGGW